MPLTTLAGKAVCKRELLKEFGLPEITLGSIPGSGGVQRLPLLVGPTRAKELIFTGRTLGAQECLAWGLANQVVQDAELMPRAMAMAREIAANAPLAVQAAKRMSAEVGDVHFVCPTASRPTRGTCCLGMSWACADGRASTAMANKAAMRVSGFMVRLLWVEW